MRSLLALDKLHSDRHVLIIGRSCEEDEGGIRLGSHMAQCEPNSLPSTHSCTDTEEASRCAIQEKSKKIQPKINRLKRVKRRSDRDRSSLNTESALSSDPMFNCEETCPKSSPDHQMFCINAQPITRAPKSEQFLLRGSMEAHVDETSKNTNHEPLTQVQSQNTFHSSSHPSTSQNHEVMTTDERLGLLELFTQNPKCTLRRCFSVQRPPSKVGRQYTRIGHSSSSSLISMAGKRKPRVDPGNDEHLQKHSEIQNLDTSENHDRPQIRVTNRNRLSIRRRKKQLTFAANAAVHKQQQKKNAPSGDDGDDDLMEGDVPWTEKYRPRCSDEVVGNPAAVKKLYSWLKEWRVKADVDERRKTREEHRIRKKNNGSWDCGDFEGDPMTEAHMGELCNTLLIHGPTGVGKTAAVYACAQELGFKIFEVNSSSLRSGCVVLSQLKECTQSHQVGASHSSCSTQKPSASLSKTGQPKVTTTSKKQSMSFQKKKRDVPASVTLKHFFRKIEKPIDTNINVSHGVCGVSLIESEIEEPVLTSKISSERKDRKAAVSLMLFEEVDVIFDDDVGFFSAVRTLMSTSKRPIVLTTNDPRFGLSFHGDFEEIRFKTPSMESVSSYLQYMCVVEGVKPDSEHLRLLVQNNKGDVRRSILELELWVCGGGGNAPSRLQRNTLACSSYTELENTGCMQVLVESWRKGQSLLYSNLELLLAPPTSHSSSQSTDCTTFLNPAVSSSSDLHRLKQRKLSRRKVKKIHDDDKPRLSELDSLAKFLNSMSFLDSHLSKKFTGVCKSGRFGVKVSDSLLDELSEEAVWTPDMERCYEIQAVVEGLGFCTCRSEVHEMMMKRPGGFKGPMMEDLNVSVEYTTLNSGVWKTHDTLLKVLYSRAFRYNGNKPAVVTDYLPILRFICKVERLKPQHEPRFPQYFEDIGLQLPKSTLKLLMPELR